MKQLLILLLVAACTGCYPMPTDDDCSLVPITNNPSLTRDSGSALPSMGY